MPAACRYTSIQLAHRQAAGKEKEEGYDGKHDLGAG